MFKEKINLGAKQESPEEIDKIKREKYEKSAAELAREKTSIIERLTGKGITKDEIIRMDAKLENEARGMAKRKPDNYRKEHLENLQSSSLKIEKREGLKFFVNDLSGQGGLEFAFSADKKVLSGEINGHKIKISAHYLKNSFNQPVLQKVEGYIDGDKMAEEDAEKIFNRYSQVADQRMNKIDQIKKGKREQSEDEKQARKNVASQKKTSKSVEEVL